MRAASSASNLPGNMYDTSNNWTTILYGWDPSPGPDGAPRLTGSWDAPIQQQQWWMSKRPLQTTVTRAPNNGDKPTRETFYELKTDYNDFSDVNFVAPAQISPPAAAGAQPSVLTGQVYFRNNHIASCDGKVWLPEGLQITGGDQWTWSTDELDPADHSRMGAATGGAIGRKLATYQDNYRYGYYAEDQMVTRNLLRSFLLPNGADITWELTPGWCPANVDRRSGARDATYHAWKAFRTSTDSGFGPNAVYNEGRYPGPGPLETTPAADLDADLSTYTPSVQQIQFLFLNPAATVGTIDTAYWQWYRDADGSPWFGGWWFVSWCPNHNVLEDTWAEGDTCTLSITPAQTDVFAAPGLEACAASLPQGVPFITCRGPDGTLRRMDPTAYNDPGNNKDIRAVVDFFVGRAVPRVDYNEADYVSPTGLLPDVACNKRAYSPRFGGRCAAPVVQYLAYDEAYHRPDNQAKYGLPEYGGCLAGGIMRYLGTNAINDSVAFDAQWNTYKEWWTPPLWPVDIWYNAVKNTGGNFADMADRSSHFLSNQQNLDHMFVYQDAFKLPVITGPAGEHSTQGSVRVAEGGIT